jgi:thiol-disulfide isomerase/thioredoxin
MPRGISLILGLCLTSLVSFAQDIPVVKYPQLLGMMENCEKAEIHIFNFWATWCKPCIEELPFLEAVNLKYENVQVSLISFDDVADLDIKVKTFVQKKGLQSKVYLLDETDYNQFIDLVDSHWSGAIPATVIVSCPDKTRVFKEGAFKEGELERIVESLK